jgi:hypothetical protein
MAMFFCMDNITFLGLGDMCPIRARKILTIIFTFNFFRKTVAIILTWLVETSNLNSVDKETSYLIS